MSPLILLAIILIYFGILLLVSYRTGKGSNNEGFFVGNKNSNWLLVAFGMVGTSLSGITFISVPGKIGKDQFHYLQISIGYTLGYIIIAYILLPLYYKLKLTSIYGYLAQRLGHFSYKSGAWIFIFSRLTGATARLYLVINILQEMILTNLGIPFIATTLIILFMILLYTYEGGVKTIIWTDTLQTTCMVLGLVICIYFILHQMNLSIPESFSLMKQHGYTSIFNTNPNEKGFFIKQILAGMFITITMTGIDQEMMQKSISVTKLKDSQKNMISLGFILFGVISLFLYLGGLLHLYGIQENIHSSGDALFPEIALHHMPSFISIIFIIALISALFPSADGAMTALTSSICIDIFDLNNRNILAQKKESFRKKTHLIVALSFVVLIFIFKIINEKSMIDIILSLATYTYGPLLGLFSFGILTQHQVKDKWVPWICLLSPIITYFIDKYQSFLFGSFQIGLELILINGFITFIGLWCIRLKKQNPSNL